MLARNSDPRNAGDVVAALDAYLNNKEKKYQWLLDNAAKWSWNPSNAYKNVSGFAHKGTGYAGYALDEAVCLAMDKDAAQPVQEPVGKFAKFTDGVWREVTNGSAGVPLYNTPQQRPWVGLTDEEIQKSYEEAYKVAQGRRLEVAFAQVIEAALRSKNT